MTETASKSPQVNRLIMAVVQEQDRENATRALVKYGFKITRLASLGGFLWRRNVTLLIGLEKGQEELAVQVLAKSCRRRVEYVATPLENTAMPSPPPMPISVGGATIFSFDVEHFEEI